MTDTVDMAEVARFWHRKMRHGLVTHADAATVDHFDISLGQLNKALSSFDADGNEIVRGRHDQN
jgi:hypothetical protein